MNKQVFNNPAQRLSGVARGLQSRAGRWFGWLLVGVMAIVLLMQISALTTRTYAVYDLEAARTQLQRERRDLVLALSTAQPLADLATTATAAGLQPAAPEQWTVLSAPTQEAHP